MFKLIILALGLAIGFGAGVWWGVQNPEQAKQLAEEEKRFLQEQLRIGRETKARLDQIAAATKKTAGPAGTSSFLGGGGGSGGGTARPDPEISRLRDDQEQQIAELEKRLEQVK